MWIGHHCPCAGGQALLLARRHRARFSDIFCFQHHGSLISLAVTCVLNWRHCCPFCVLASQMGPAWQTSPRGGYDNHNPTLWPARPFGAPAMFAAQASSFGPLPFAKCGDRPFHQLHAPKRGWISQALCSSSPRLVCPPMPKPTWHCTSSLGGCPGAEHRHSVVGADCTDLWCLNVTLRRGGVKFCKPVVGAAGGVDEEFESKGKGLSLALMLRHSSLKVATMAMKTWLLWVR